MNILVIPDAHAKPEISNRRFDWLGKMVVDLRPDVVVELGDWEDMPSLSSYDIGKKSYEGRRYRKDLEAAWDARERFIGPLRSLQLQQKKNKEKQYRPTCYALGGNHFEGRINRAIELSPMLEGTIGVKDGRHEEFGWEYVPYKEVLEIEGFSFSHYFTSGIMGKPIGGEHPATMLISKLHTSAIQGHSHLFDVSLRTKPDGNRVWGIHSGCYLDPDQVEDYAGPANKMWKKGVLYMKDVKKGDMESFEWIGIQNIENKYAVKVEE